MSGHSLCCLVVASASVAIALQAAPAPQFDRDIRPILQKHCVGCHSGASAQAYLDLRSRESLLKGGISGPAIAPGSAERSPLYQRVVSGKMPPAGPLAKEDVAIRASGSKPVPSRDRRQR